MHFMITREKLLKIFRAISGIVDKKINHNPILANILLRINDDDLEIYATDLEMELTARVNVDQIIIKGQTTVPFRKINDICRTLPNDSVLDLKLLDNKLLIKSARSKFSLTTLPAENFPDVHDLIRDNSLIAFSLSASKLRWLMEKTAFAMADQDVRYFLNGMLFEIKNTKLFAVAADGHRLAMNCIDVADDIVRKSQENIRVIIPRKGVLEIMRIISEGEGIVTVNISRSHIQISSSYLTITVKLLDGKFPDYESVIPREEGTIVIGARDKLKEAFTRASALFSERFRAIKLQINNNVLKVLANTNEKDEVEEDLEVEQTGNEIEVGFNVRYLLDFLSVAQSSDIKIIFNDQNQSTLIQEVGGGGEGAYVLMPIRT